MSDIDEARRAVQALFIAVDETVAHHIRKTLLPLLDELVSSRELLDEIERMETDISLDVRLLAAIVKVKRPRRLFYPADSKAST
jgi:hypothetical protein